MRKFFVLVFVCIVCLSSAFFGYAQADYYPTFGGGYNNTAQEEAKVMSILASVLALRGIYYVGSEYLGSNNSESIQAQFTYSIVEKLHAEHNALYQKCAATEVVFDGGSAAIKWLAGGWVPADFEELYTFLFGSNALNGDPVQTNLQTQFSIDVDGVKVIPWVSNSSVRGNNPIYDTNWVKTRGEYIPIYDGAYMSFFNDVYDSTSPASHQKYLTFNILQNNDTYYTMSTSKFRANTGTDTDGVYYNTSLYNGNYWYYCWYYFEDVEKAACPAWLWVFNKDQGQLWLFYYSYVYAGVLKPWNDHNFVYMPAGDCGNKSIKKFNNGEIILKGDGISPVDEVPEQTIVPGNTYQDIVNNFVDNTLIIQDPYTDPSTWDTSTGGTATPDGNGGFNIDLGSFHMPDLNIDWKIEGLKNKFPFSIPWDIINFFTILNVEPEAPHLEGEIDLGITIWEIDFDFSEFDDIASLFRTLFYLSFVVGLIFYTKDFLKR